MPPQDLELNAAELTPLLEAQTVRLVDVREHFEVQHGIIPGAQHIPLGQLPQRYSEIVMDKPVVVYCAHGVRSFQGAYFLRSVGFEGAKSLSGGMAYWAGYGGAVVRPDAKGPEGKKG